MASVKKVGDLQIDQDTQFQENEWKVERVGWILGLIIVIAALAGLFGSGPLSSRTAQNGPLEVQYQRFTRFQSPNTVSIRLQPEQIQDGQASIWVDRRFIDQYEINKIVPEPDAAHLLPDRIVYDFQVDQADEPLLIAFYLESNRIGSVQGRVGEERTERVVDFSQFVYP